MAEETQWYRLCPHLGIYPQLPRSATLESMEILGETKKINENDAYPSLATRTRSSPAMRVKLQLVICHDTGHEETVTDVITLNKNHQRIEHLGLSLAEATQRLSTIQRHLLQQQVNTWSCT